MNNLNHLILLILFLFSCNQFKDRKEMNNLLKVKNSSISNNNKSLDSSIELEPYPSDEQVENMDNEDKKYLLIFLRAKYDVSVKSEIEKYGRKEFNKRLNIALKKTVTKKRKLLKEQKKILKEKKESTKIFFYKSYLDKLVLSIFILSTFITQTGYLETYFNKNTLFSLGILSMMLNAIRENERERKILFELGGLKYLEEEFRALIKYLQTGKYIPSIKSEGFIFNNLNLSKVYTDKYPDPSFFLADYYLPFNISELFRIKLNKNDLKLGIRYGKCCYCFPYPFWFKVGIILKNFFKRSFCEFLFLTIPVSILISEALQKSLLI
ncbi:MAG: hypothetical protein GY830_10865 [Bacteroidetes bacterium]|nr:hypothetical protein [Bacteroidota bacterium]